MSPAQVLAALLSVDGSGSLLDADLLDGLEGIEYAKSSVIVGAGAGLSGGGALTASFSLAVGAGPGIEVARIQWRWPRRWLGTVLPITRACLPSVLAMASWWRLIQCRWRQCGRGGPGV